MAQNKTLSESIADQIRKRIITGEYPIDSQLPNEQDLAVSLNVSRTTIREAVKLRVSSNVLEIERGRGTFVSAIPGLSDDPLGLDFVPADRLASDLSFFRRVIEADVCALAAKNASASQLEEMDTIICGMRRLAAQTSEPPYDEDMIDNYINTEIAFHSLVYKMSHNVIFDRLSTVIARSVVANYTTLLYRSGFNLAENCRIHENLFRAIATHDCEKARKLGEKHIEDFIRIL